MYSIHVYIHVDVAMEVLYTCTSIGCDHITPSQKHHIYNTTCTSCIYMYMYICINKLPRNYMYMNIHGVT